MVRSGPRCAQGVAFVLAAAAMLAGCPRYGVIDDGTSIAWGPGEDGKLMHSVRLPRRGDGYWIPPRWSHRGLNYGTDEMVALIAHVGRTLAAEGPDMLVGVGDVAWEKGGPSAWHRSHQTGLDADILFFATDASGHPKRMKSMPHFRADGKTAYLKTRSGRSIGKLRFDIARNWKLARAVIQNPVARVQYIFVYDPLKQLMLDYARKIGEPQALIEHASYLLHQPENAAPHDDHFHVRLYCPESDAVHGCRDYGERRWGKRDRKYDRPQHRRMAALPRVNVSHMPVMVSLSALPFRGFVPR